MAQDKKAVAIQYLAARARAEAREGERGTESCLVMEQSGGFVAMVVVTASPQIAYALQVFLDEVHAGPRPADQDN